jgi:hydroxymethylpyrimidine pyrophosphatase-like HAD family hydrolase
MGRELTARLVEHFAAREYPVLLLYDADQTGGLDYELVRGHRNAAAYEQFLRLAPARVERIDGWSARSFEPVRIGIIDSPDQIQATTRLLHESFLSSELKFNPIYAPNYDLHVVECFAPAVNKWYGIMRVAERLQITPDQIVTIGDDVNDYEMIREAGLGIAMGNAVEKIKTAARWHAPTQDQCGVAAAVDAILSGRDLPQARVA